MVKKNLVNKNVIRALSLGLSIAMASQPLTAMAAEVNPIDDPATKDVHEYEDKQVADEAQGAASDAWDAVEKADGSIEKVVSDVNEKFGTATGEDVSNVLQAAGALAPQEQAPVVEEAAAESNEETADAAESENAVADDVVREAVPAAVVKNDECDRAEEDIKKSNDQLEIAEAQDIAKTNNANQAYDKAQEIVEEVNTANETISNAADKAEKLASTATNSTDAVVASKAVADLGKVVNEAEKAYNDAAENVEALEKAYDIAKENLKTANENYNNSLGEAKKEQVKAAKELEAAETKLANLETALTTAQNNFKDANEKALNLVSAWETVAAKKTWTSTDAFFEAVFKNYADENLLGEGVYAEKVEIIRGVGNQYYNYIKVTTADGTVKNFNYKQAVSGKIGDIKIYPVSDDEVALDEYATQYFKTHAYDSTNESHNTGYKYTENNQTKYILKVELEQMKAAGTVVELDGYYWITNGAGDPVTVVSEVEAKRANVGTDENNKETYNKVTAVDIDENTKTDSWRVNKDGTLEKATLADVYRTEYEKKTLESGYTYTSQAAAEEAMAQAILTLADAYDLDDTTQAKTFYQKVVTYLPAWYASFTDGSGDNGKNRVRTIHKESGAENWFLGKVSELLAGQNYSMQEGSADFDATWLKSWIFDIKFLHEDYKVEGHFTAVKNGVAVQTYTGAESETYDGANFDTESTINGLLANDGYTGFNKLHYKDTKGNSDEDFVNITFDNETYILKSENVNEKQKYKYAIEYLKKLGEAEKNNEEVSYQQYEEAIKLIDKMLADDSQYGEKNFITNDEDFRKLINDTKTVRDYYVTVLSELATAKQDVKDAKTAVATLGTKITALEAREDQLDVKAVKAELIKLVKEYNKMEANEDLEKLSVEELKQILDNTVTDAKEKLAGLQQNVKNLQGQLTSANNSLERFRYTPDDDATEPGTGAITTETPVVVPLTMDNATGVAGVRTGRRAAGNGAANAVATNEATTTRTFANQGPALAASVDDTQKLQDFQKGNVALAPAVEAQETIAWWWALIIVVFGGSGYALYKKFHSKKDDNK